MNDSNVRPNLCEVIPPLPRLIRPSIKCTNHCAPHSSTYVRRIVNEGQKRRWEWLPPAQVKLTRCECLPSEVLLLINLRLIGRGETCKRSYDVYRIIAVMPSGDRYHAIRQPLCAFMPSASVRFRVTPDATGGGLMTAWLIRYAHAAHARYTHLMMRIKRGGNGCPPFHSGSVFQT